MKTIIKILFFFAATLAIANVFAFAIDSPQYTLPVAGGLFLLSMVRLFSPQLTNGLALAIIDPSGLTFNGEEARTFRDVVLDMVYPKPKLTQIHTVLNNIVTNKQIPILGIIDLSGRKHNTSSCAPAPNGGEIITREKTWTPVSISDRFTECWTNLLDQFYVWAEQRGYKRADLTSTDIWSFLEERVADAIWAATFRHAWFGDTASDTIANSGTLTNGTDKTFFNAIDGLWKQLFGITSGDATKKVLISQNGGNSYVNQQFTSTDTSNNVATGIFESMLYNADMRLSGQNNMQFLATRSLCNQYKKERRKVTNVESSYILTDNGFRQLMYEGIPIVEVEEWDRLINAYYNNGTVWNKPHRAVLTTKTNIPLGFDDADNYTTWESFYNPVDKNSYLDYMFRMDSKVVLDYMVMVAGDAS